VSLDALTYFDWVMSTDFDLEACAFGEAGASLAGSGFGVGERCSRDCALVNAARSNAAVISTKQERQRVEEYINEGSWLRGFLL
jgi:hypothetical protein